MIAAACRADAGPWWGARIMRYPDGGDRSANLSKHLAFGFGRHRCIGEHLARMQIRVALDELLDRIPSFTLAPEATVGLKTGSTRGPLNLPVIW
jgi:cytochrome P450